MSSNRIIRHCTLCLLSVLISAAIYSLTGSKQIVAGISIATAYTSLAYFLATMSIGPINLILAKANPLSSYLRRDIAIWSAILALAHTIAGLQVHLGGKFWLYFFYPEEHSQLIPVRYDLFGLTNHLGLACSILLLCLLLLSNNRAIRKLGSKKWKQWQKSTYFLAIAIPLHGYIYQFIESRIGVFTTILSVILALLIIIQSTGIAKYRKSDHRSKNMH
jgi:methionine sulfoxide reductase heme-binding subunit